MNGLDMGVATRLGSLGFVAALWVGLMAAICGAAPPAEAEGTTTEETRQ